MPISAIQHRISISNVGCTFRKSSLLNNKTHSNHTSIFMSIFIIYLFLFDTLNCYKPTNAQCNKMYNFRPIFYIKSEVNFPFSNSKYIPIPHSIHNKHMRIVNGNTNKNKNLDILHINKGSSILDNCLHNIDHLINKYKPDILHLAEANPTRTLCMLTPLILLQLLATVLPPS